MQLKSVRAAQYMKSFRKELLELSHACGYEHPSQMTMDDVKLSMGDNNLTLTLEEIFTYTKDKVEWESVGALRECEYLGAEPTKVKKTN